MLKISGSDQLKIQPKSASMSEKCHTSHKLETLKKEKNYTKQTT